MHGPVQACQRVKQDQGIVMGTPKSRHIALCYRLRQRFYLLSIVSVKPPPRALLYSAPSIKRRLCYQRFRTLLPASGPVKASSIRPSFGTKSPDYHTHSGFDTEKSPDEDFRCRRGVRWTSFTMDVSLFLAKPRSRLTALNQRVRSSSPLMRRTVKSAILHGPKPPHCSPQVAASDHASSPLIHSYYFFSCPA